MKVVYTNQSILSLEELLYFLIEVQGVSQRKAIIIKNLLLNRAEKIHSNPYVGQKEGYLEDLKENHRRIIEGNFKIIYKISNNTVYIIDFFDSRQSPSKMKG